MQLNLNLFLDEESGEIPERRGMLSTLKGERNLARENQRSHDREAYPLLLLSAEEWQTSLSLPPHFCWPAARPLLTRGNTNSDCFVSNQANREPLERGLQGCRC